MKKQTIYLFLFAFCFLFSCSDESFDAGTEKEVWVDFAVTTSIPQDIVTYAGSGEGGLSNVDPAIHSLRYILEIWTKESMPRLAYRAYQIVGNDFATTSISFSARLLALEYDFVFWADFTDKDNPYEDRYYQTNNGQPDPIGTADQGLREITRIGDYTSNEARAAYYAKEEVDLSQKNKIEEVHLISPFGKIRFFTDAATPPAYASLVYKDPFPTSFNALTGVVSLGPPFFGEEINEPKMESITIEGTTYTCLLAFDYIFAMNNQIVDCTLTTYDAGQSILKSREIENIPVARNKITTITL
jgi:hypothetical protein